VYEDRITIATPEGVDLEITLAGVGSRFAAALIDTLLQSTGLFVVLFAIGVIAGSRDSGGDGAALLLIAFFVVFSFLVLFGYHVLFETLASGRTPGKRWLGLRVVRAGGRPVGFTASVIRNLLRLVDFLPASYLVGFVTVLATARNQRVGDLAAGTLVVRERTGGRRSRASTAAAPVSTDHLPAGYDTWDVSMVRPDELSTIRRFLERRTSLTPDARWRLAWQLAERLRPSVAGAPEDLHPEVFLEAVAAAKAARH